MIMLVKVLLLLCEPDTGSFIDVLTCAQLANWFLKARVLILLNFCAFCKICWFCSSLLISVECGKVPLLFVR